MKETNPGKLFYLSLVVLTMTSAIAFAYAWKKHTAPSPKVVEKMAQVAGSDVIEHLPSPIVYRMSTAAHLVFLGFQAPKNQPNNSF